ncbi:MAG: GldG family protein [Clostridia bacterium]|nr:GldG family protein [Clostridia bacterium]
MNNNKPENSFQASALKMGSTQAVFCAVIIVIAILVNMIFAKLPATYTQFDLSASSLFTLSAQTTELCKNLENPVTLYHVVETGSEDDRIVSLLDRYAAAGNVTVHQIDPVLYPAFTGNYTQDVVNNGSVIVVCGERSKVVDNLEIVVPVITNQDYYMLTGQPDGYEFDGEGAITSAIHYVTTDELPTIYTLEGHGETALPDYILSLIAKDNYTISSLSLMSAGGIPEDCNALIINSPRNDLSENELNLILTYMEQGGSVILLSDFGTGIRPNFDALMATYGLQFVDGVVVERDSAYYFASGYNHYLLPGLGEHEITASLLQNNLYVLMPQAMGIAETSSHRSTLRLTSLLTTTEQAYAKPNATTATTMEKEDGDIDGPFSVAAVVTESSNGGETKLAVYASSLLLNEELNNLVSGGNSDIFLSTIGWMCDYEQSMNIHAKPLAADALVVPADKANLWSAVAVIGVPLFILLSGVIIVLDRRKK